jgi:hypothetical protein
MQFPRRNHGVHHCYRAVMHTHSSLTTSNRERGVTQKRLRYSAVLMIDQKAGRNASSEKTKLPHEGLESLHQMQISTMESLDMFATVVAVLFVLWAFAQILAHLMDEMLWWALPTKAKIVIKDAQWRITTAIAQVAVWKYNFHNRIARRWPNTVTLGLRANAECDMRKAINIAEANLEELSLLLNGIQE